MPSWAVFTTRVDDRFGDKIYQPILLGESLSPYMGNPLLTRQKLKGPRCGGLEHYNRSGFRPPVRPTAEYEARNGQFQNAANSILLLMRLPEGWLFGWIRICWFVASIKQLLLVKSEFTTCWSFFCLVPNCCLSIPEFCQIQIKVFAGSFRDHQICAA